MIKKIFKRIRRWAFKKKAIALSKKMVSEKFPSVLGLDETINKVLAQKSSVVRFGDGELFLMFSRSIGFQRKNKKLKEELKAIATTSDCLVCIPDIFDKERNKQIFVDRAAKYWNEHLEITGGLWKKIFAARERIYGNAFISRFYIDYKEKEFSLLHVDKLKKLWEGRDIYIIEGDLSRLGVGNDLFCNSKSIQRILGPSKNAYDKIDEIQKFVEKDCSKQNLILLALGPTATVLAYRLSQSGFQAIDIGHVDIEYEWMLMGATEKIAIKNKHVNEAAVGGDKIAAEENETYTKQVIADFSK